MGQNGDSKITRLKKVKKTSWKNYDSTIKNKEGAQGLPGFETINAVHANRNVTGIYVDLESDINDHLLIDIAGRYEYYSNYGGNLAGKLAVRYKFSDKFLLRGRKQWFSCTQSSAEFFSPPPHHGKM